MPLSLSAPPLLDSLVTPNGPWRSLRVLGVVGSTNAEAALQPRPWEIVTAQGQESGRGRHARVWVSPAGTSVSMSMTVPCPPRPQDWGWLPLLAGLAVHDGLSAVVEQAGGDTEVGLKWPNDVLIRGGSQPEWGKVCGILCEMQPEALVVVGIGINVAVPRADLPVPTATSLHLAGLDPLQIGQGMGAREGVIVAVARAFAQLHQAWSQGGPALEAVRRRYRLACLTIGAEVDLHTPGEVIVTGTVTDIDEDGRLLIAGAEGIQAYAAGDVVHVRVAERA
ncbi:biotin--[acetyl-CoA-carboxylase] ligase [Gephyromycinifex aptenodytis]|uniref:biotin--[acetyl-CoA-carboxylase] ligase n=1 Tax=Gephyromycinifex aptenodytis TaxID=2716227 RepID=UPI00144700CC|nr:biotin--[acetyl-CoA-carboxylase] ligase [Gephyromycinifex aptenodytis]